MTPAQRAGTLAFAEPLADGLVVLRGFTTRATFARDLAAIEVRAPFRRMLTPSGRAIRVEMTNCGAYGWVADRAGYRYAETDPLGGLPWPPLPQAWRDLAVRAALEAGFDFAPDACLINRYGPGVGMGAHRDTDERDARQPIVTVSLGATATFFFGPKRTGLRRTRLADGDVVVMGGAQRHAYHGIAPLGRGAGPDGVRISLTFRRAA
ncbi:MAG: DNA oxidative demethylase AlkB [Vulcanimicrobiaceae bacterium]